MKVSIQHRCSDYASYRAARVKSLFNCQDGCNFNLDAELPIDDAGWKLGVVVGPSGSGKSSIAAAIWPEVPIHAPSWPAGYHPSLLPLHRGRDAVRWAIRQRDRVTGGSVYWMNDSVDGGDIAAQEHVFIRPGDTAEELWRRELFPLGLRLLARVLGDLAGGVMVRVPQSNDLATWEPALDRVPLFRPELPQLGTIEGFEVVRSASALV